MTANRGILADSDDDDEVELLMVPPAPREEAPSPVASPRKNPTKAPAKKAAKGLPQPQKTVEKKRTSPTKQQQHQQQQQHLTLVPASQHAVAAPKGCRNFYDDEMLGSSTEPMSAYDRLVRLVMETNPVIMVDDNPVGYTPSAADKLAKLVFACMITDTGNYTSLDTLHSYVRTNSKTRVRNFISKEVLQQKRPPSKVDQALANTCYEAIHSFMGLLKEDPKDKEVPIPVALLPFE